MRNTFYAVMIVFHVIFCCGFALSGQQTNFIQILVSTGLEGIHNNLLILHSESVISDLCCNKLKEKTYEKTVDYFLCCHNLLAVC